MKTLLDKYLQYIPDQSEYPGMIPGAKTLYGSPSNSIADQGRMFNIDISTGDCVDTDCMSYTGVSIDGLAQPKPSHGV